MPMDYELQLSLVMQATGANRAAAQRFLPWLNQYASEYGLTTPNRILAFLSQVGTESGGLTKLREDLHYRSPEQVFAAMKRLKEQENEVRALFTTDPVSGKVSVDWEKLGDLAYGDHRLRGGGLLHLTREENYMAFTEAMQAKGFKVDFVKDPDLLNDPQWATLSALEFWKNKKLNRLADQLDLTEPLDGKKNKDVWERITKGVNGGLNGHKERTELLKRARDRAQEIQQRQPIDLSPPLRIINDAIQRLMANIA